MPAGILGCAVALAVVLAAPSGFAEPRMGAFASGHRLITPMAPGLVKVLLPRALCRGAAGGERRDIRVFTLEGRPTPHFQAPADPAGGSCPLFFRTAEGQRYVLVYGNAQVGRLAPPPGLAREVAAAGPRVAAARLGPRVSLGAAAVTKNAPGSPAGRMLLPSTLLLGAVLLVGGIVWWRVRRRLR